MISLKLSDSMFVSITGVTGVSINDIDNTLSQIDKIAVNTPYQLFDADYIAGSNHIYYAAANAQYAIINRLNISNSLSIETLLYAACENQITKAIKMLGVSNWTYNVAVSVFSKTESDPLTVNIGESLGKIDDSVLELTPEKYGKLKDLFDISDESIKAVGKEPYDALLGLITEKGALVGLRR